MALGLIRIYDAMHAMQCGRYAACGMRYVVCGAEEWGWGWADWRSHEHRVASASASVSIRFDSLRFDSDPIGVEVRDDDDGGGVSRYTDALSFAELNS